MPHPTQKGIQFSLSSFDPTIKAHADALAQGRGVSLRQLTESLIEEAYRKEIEMKPRIEVWIDTSDDAMVGGGGWQQFDPSASVDEFLSQVRERLERCNPDYEIVLHQTNHRNEAQIFDAQNEDTLNDDGASEVMATVSDVWEAQEWYIENDEPEEEEA